MCDRWRIVTNVADPLRREVLFEDHHHLLAHCRRDPGIHAVSDDVVELPEACVDIHDVAMQQLDVAEAQCGDILLAALDRHAAQVDTDERAVWMLKGHRQQVAANAAAKLEHPATLDRSCLHAVDGSNGGEMVRMSEPVDVAGVVDLVVWRGTGARVAMLGLNVHHPQFHEYANLSFSIETRACLTSSLASDLLRNSRDSSGSSVLVMMLSIIRPPESGSLQRDTMCSTTASS